MGDDRTPQQVQEDRDRLSDTVSDAIAVADRLQGPLKSLALPGLISGLITSKSLGGLLRKLFGVSNRDVPYVVQTQTYPMITGAVVGVTTTDFINISQDSDFYAIRMAITAGNDGAGTLDTLLQLRYQSKDMRWSSNPNGGHILGYQGTGQRPFIFPQPLFIPRNQTVAVGLTPLTANARTYFIDFIGRKTVDVSSLDLTTRRW